MKTTTITGILKEFYPKRYSNRQKIRVRAKNNIDYYFVITNLSLLHNICPEDLITVISESHRQGHYFVHSITLIQKAQLPVIEIFDAEFLNPVIPYHCKKDDSDIPF
jgi:hypothetical protein